MRLLVISTPRLLRGHHTLTRQHRQWMNFQRNAFKLTNPQIPNPLNYLSTISPSLTIPISTCPFQPGDLVQVKAGRSQLGLIIAQKPGPSKSTFFLTLLLPDGHMLNVSSNDVTFKISSWSRLPESIPSPKALSAAGTTIETREILEKIQIPVTITDALVTLQGKVHEMIANYKKVSQKLYVKFPDLNVLSTERAGQLMFEKETLNPAEKIAAFHLMFDNTLTYDAIEDKGVPGQTLFCRKPAEEVQSIYKLMDFTMANGSKKSLAHETFLEKCRKRILAARNGDPVPPGTEFNSIERPLLNSIYRALGSSLKYPCFYKHFSVFAILQKLAPLYPPRPGDACLIDFAKEVGMIAPWENPAKFLYTAKQITGHSFSEMITTEKEQLSTETLARHWADRLLSEGIFTLGENKGQPTKNEEPDENVQILKNCSQYTVEEIAPRIQDHLAKIGIKEVEKMTSKSYSSDLCEHIRHDFGDLPVYIIDAPDAHELDDGVSVETTPQGDWIHVHVADPTAYIPPTHPLSIMAAIRSKSVYIPETCSPMMPGDLSDKRLNIGLSPFALTFSALLDDKGDITNYKVRPSILRNTRTLSYDQVNGLLSWNDCHQRNMPEEQRSDWLNAYYSAQKSFDSSELAMKEEGHRNDLLKLQKLAKLHFAARCRAGALQGDGPSMDIKISPYPLPKPVLFSNPPYYFSHTDKNSFEAPPNISLEPSFVPIVSPAHSTVSESMVIAGRVAALFCRERGIPGVYRGQSLSISPGDSNYSKFMGVIERERDSTTGLIPYVSFMNQIVPCLNSAFISDSPVDHHSMGLISGPGYMKVTSPLRRYIDLMLHWNIKASLLESPFPFSKEKLKPLARHCFSQERLSKGLSMLSDRYWALEWMRRRESFWASDRPDLWEKDSGTLPPDHPSKVSSVINYGGTGSGGISRSVLSSSKPITYRALVLGQARYRNGHQVALSNLGLVKAVLLGSHGRSLVPGETVDVMVDRIYLSSRYLEVRPASSSTFY